MNFKVEYWDDERYELKNKWFKDFETSLKYAESLKVNQNITSIIITQILWEYEG